VCKWRLGKKIGENGRDLAVFGRFLAFLRKKNCKNTSKKKKNGGDLGKKNVEMVYNGERIWVLFYACGVKKKII
jgi:hypothetical protein